MPNTPAHTHAHAAAQLVATDVTVTRGATTVLDHLDLTISAGARLAVVGDNGRGKTTLLHVLAGHLEPDGGSVRRTGTLALAEQEMSTAAGRTVGDAVAEAIAPELAALADLDMAAQALGTGALGTGPSADGGYAEALARAEALEAWDAERRIDLALEALGAVTDRARRLDTMSVGQRHLVRLACMLGASDDFLLLDEPTNHLDRSGLDFLTARLRKRTGAVVLVSHDRALLADVADDFLDLDPSADGRPRRHGGGYAAHLAARRAERVRWEQEYAEQQAAYDRLAADLDAARDRLTSGWRPPKGTGKHTRATRAAGLVQAVHRREQQLDAARLDVPPPPMRLAFPDLPAGEGLLLAADEVGVTGRLAPTAVEIEAGARLVVTGPNGAGKSTLLSVLGGREPDTGQVKRGEDVRVGHLAQESVLPLDRKAEHLYADTAADGAPPLADLGLLRPDEAAKRIGELSIGQQRRLDLALVLARRPHVLLLDEPTNHLSAALVDELTDALRATYAAVVLTTHDRQLLRDLLGGAAAWNHLALG